MKSTRIQGISARAVLAVAVISTFLGTTRPSSAQTLGQPFQPDEINRAGVLAQATPASSPRAESAPPAATPASVFLQPEVRAALPATSAVQTTDSEYILAPNDAIEMTIFREPDLTTRATISRDGTVQFPLINDIKIAGMTIKEAAT